MKYTLVENWRDAPCYLVAINANLIPIVAGRIKDLEQRYSWLTDEDHQRGYDAFVELEACMTRLCVDELIESNNRLYRMLDTAIYGRAYAIAQEEPLLVEPVINPTHALVYENDASLLGRVHDIQQLLQNALNGTATQHYDRENGIRDTLESILTALQEQESLDPDILAKLSEIAVLLA